MKRLAILGAGPIGLEAALAARDRGYWVEVYERGAVAASVRAWGHMQMFSPFSMNSSDAGRTLLQAAGHTLPDADALLTGEEYAKAYLQPLADHLGLPIHLHTEVQSIARQHKRKTELIGDPQRMQVPFRLHLREGGEERYAECDLAFDCTGTFLTPNPLGSGGQMALGEGATAGRIEYGVAKSTAELPTCALVVGGGHSAASAVRDLVQSGAREMHWLRLPGAPLDFMRILHDPLPGRDRLASAVNGFIAQGRLQLHSGYVRAVAPLNGSRVWVEIETPAGRETLLCDRVVCATGFRPDQRLARELHVQTCWATEGTYPLAASLLGETGGDCLAVPAQGAESLRHPEPGYFALGVKSYGRTPDFLLRTGLEQIRALLAALAREGD